MENPIEVGSADVKMNITLKNNINRNKKSQNKIFLVEENYEPVFTICNQHVRMNSIWCSKCHWKTDYKSSL